MTIELAPHEARVIGCLVEKEIATPEQYPLSLNALVGACNQKSNRDPVLELDEATVQRTLDALAKKYLVSEETGHGSRVAKYRHRFCNSEYGTLKFSPRELAVVCELLLRGPQTPGELRTRVPRMTPLGDPAEIEAALQALAGRESGPLVVRLAREPGRRDARYAQLFTGEIDADAETPLEAAPAQPAPQAPTAPPPDDDRLSRLEAQVHALRAELDELKSRLTD
jgi:uncharacterized protein YceH (UPF0502 family)